jgi:hypothetical protein
MQKIQDFLWSAKEMIEIKGQVHESIRQYQETVRLKPDDAGARTNLLAAFDRKRRIDKPVNQLPKAAPNLDIAD